MDIEQRALELVNEVNRENGCFAVTLPNARAAYGRCFTALCRAIEAGDAFRLEVSEAVEQYERELNGGAGDFSSLRRFIIQPKPDPLGDVIREIWPDDPFPSGSSHLIRAALKSRGLEIREVV